MLIKQFNLCPAGNTYFCFWCLLFKIYSHIDLHIGSSELLVSSLVHPSLPKFFSTHSAMFERSNEMYKQRLITFLSYLFYYSKLFLFNWKLNLSPSLFSPASRLPFLSANQYWTLIGFPSYQSRCRSGHCIPLRWLNNWIWSDRGSDSMYFDRKLWKRYPYRSSK